MVKKVLKIFHYEFGGLMKAAIVLSLSSIISSLLGLFRDHLLAGTFGASQSLDIYYAAFKIPDFIYILSLSIVSVTVLIPFLLEKISSSSNEAGKKFLNSIFSTFLLLMILLMIVSFFLASYLSKLIAPGFSPEAMGQLIILTRILLLSPLLLGLSNLLSSVVQSFNRFFIYALSPILYNIGIIFGIVFLSPPLGLPGIVLGVILGALMHVSVQIPSIIKLGFPFKFTTKINFQEDWQVIKLSFPRTVGLGLNQLVFIFITAIASLFASGSIAVFNLSFNLQSVPLSVIGLSFSVAAFPLLAKLFVSNQKNKFLAQTITALRQIIFWSIPVTILLIVLRAQIVRVIFGSGRFGWKDTRLTAAALGLFAVSITAQALILLLTRAFYAAGKTSRPIVVNAALSIFIIVSILLCLQLITIFPWCKSFFGMILRVGDIHDIEVLLLPLIFSIGMIINALVLIEIFQRGFGRMWQDVRGVFYQVMVASVLMGAVTYFSLNVLDKIFNVKTFIGIFFQGFIAAVFGMGFWFISLWTAKNKELREIVSSLKQRFWKEPAITPEPEELP